jgi:amino acid transporter/nucleotide-binding universal stress UspA family protein
MIQKEERLSKSLGFFAVYAIGTGTMIGAGIFVLPGIAISTAGPAATLSFILGGLITLITTLSIVELATGMPKAGGTYYFISRALGPLIGTIIGLGAWLALVFKGAFALIGLSEYLRVFFPIPIIGTAIIAGLVLIYLNFRGAKNSGRFQNFILVGLLGILFAFIVSGTMIGDKGNIGPFMPYGVTSVFRTTGLIFISYLGITQLAAISEEVKEPEKNIPRAFISSVVTVIGIYAGIIIVVNALVPFEELISTSTPLVTAAHEIAGTAGGIAITIAGFFATVSTANAAIMSSSRFPFAMARDKMLPDSFITIHKKHQTPYKAIILTGGIMICLLLVFDVEGLAKLGSTINVLIFVLVNIAVIVFRRSKIEYYEPTFKSPLFPLTQVVGIIGSLMLLPSLGWGSMLFAGLIIAFGIIWYLAVGREKISIDFGLKQVLKNEVRKENQCSDAVLVPIANPTHEKDLLLLSSLVSNSLIAFNIITVPEQTDLETAQNFYHNSNHQLVEQFENNVIESLKDYSGRKKYLLAFDHSVHNAIIEQAREESAELIVLGWGKNKFWDKALGSVTSNVVAKSKNNIAILKGAFNSNVQNISIAYDDDQNANYGATLGLKIAKAIQANVSLIHVLDPEVSDFQEQKIRKKMEDISEKHDKVAIKIVRKFSLLDTLIEESKQVDLLIIGDGFKKMRKGILDNVTEKIAKHASSSVLITRKYDVVDQYLKFFE